MQVTAPLRGGVPPLSFNLCMALSQWKPRLENLYQQLIPNLSLAGSVYKF